MNLCSKNEPREARILKEDFLQPGKADPWRDKGEKPKLRSSAVKADPSWSSKLRSSGKVDSERSSALGVPTSRCHDEQYLPAGRCSEMCVACSQEQKEGSICA